MRKRLRLTNSLKSTIWLQSFTVSETLQTTVSLNSFFFFKNLKFLFHLAEKLDGYPDLEVSEQLNKLGVPMNPDSFKEKENILKHSLKNWLLAITAIIDPAKPSRLHLLDIPQRILFIKLLKSLANHDQQQQQQQSALSELSPYIQFCFPEFLNAQTNTKGKLTNVELLSDQFLSKWIFEFLPRLKNLKTAEDRLKEADNLLTLILKQLEQQTQDRQQEIQLICKLKAPENPVVIIGEKATDTDVFQFLLETNTWTKPHPSQLFYCDPQNENPEYELKAFLLRIRHIPLPFYLIGMNKLVSSGREVVLKFVANLLENSKDSFKGKLYLIFTEKLGLQTFEFLVSEQMNISTKANDLKEQYSPSKVIQAHSIQQLIVLNGPTRCGKSHDIRYKLNQMKNANIISRSVVIAVNEDFSPVKFIERMNLQNDLMPDRAVGIHFNVSPYANYNSFSEFLHNLTAWGIIWDRKTGKMKQLRSPNMKPTEWFIFVELGCVPEQDDSYKDASTPEKVLLKLPCLKLLANIYENLKCPFEPDKKAAICVQTARLYRSKPPTRDGKYWFDHFVSVSVPSNQAPTPQEIDELFQIVAPLIQSSGLDRSNATKQRFLKLLIDRCEWMIHYVKKLVALDGILEDGLFTRYFELFVEESATLCMTRVWKPDSPPFITARYTPPESNELEPASLTIVDFGAKARPHLAINNIEAFTLDQVRKTDSLLRQGQNKMICLSNSFLFFLYFFNSFFLFVLAVGSGLHVESGDVYPVLQQQDYVLTPDFAVKLLFLMDRMKSGVNVVFSGDSGLGKTELLSIFTDLLNKNSSFFPAILVDFYRFISRELVQLNPEWKQQMGLTSESKRQEFIEQLKIMCEMQRRVMKGNIPTFVPWFEEVRDRVMQWIINYCEKFADNQPQKISLKLLALPEALINILAEIKKEGYEKTVKTWNQALFLERVQLFLQSKLKNMFFRILVHQNWTPDQFRQEVKKIKDAAIDFANHCNLAKEEPIRIVCFIE